MEERDELTRQPTEVVDAPMTDGDGAVAVATPPATVEEPDGVAPAHRLLPGSRQGWVLAVCCVAQFIVVLDVTIVNVALPAIRAGLRLSARGEQWVPLGSRHTPEDRRCGRVVELPAGIAT
jgi:hypothetical protein